MPLPIATAPGSWGVEPHDPRARPPWTRVLDEIAAAGFQGTELGPFGYLPPRATDLAAALRARGLRLVAGYVMEPLEDARRLDSTLEIADRTASVLASLGAERLVLIDALNPERSRTAGRAGSARRLDERGWRQLVMAVSEIAEIAARYGLRAAYHPHAGTYVEFEDEIERLLSDVGPALLDLCVDTGHCAYAGIDPVDLYRRNVARATYLHLKDIRGEVLDAARSDGLNFEAAVGAGVFCPLGDGMIDFEQLAVALEAARYTGWATVEQDRLPGTEHHALSDARASVRYLRYVGIAAEDRSRGDVSDEAAIQ